MDLAESALIIDGMGPGLASHVVALSLLGQERVSRFQSVYSLCAGAYGVLLFLAWQKDMLLLMFLPPRWEGWLEYLWPSCGQGVLPCGLAFRPDPLYISKLSLKDRRSCSQVSKKTGPGEPAHEQDEMGRKPLDRRRGD